MKKLFILGILCLASLTVYAQRFALLDFQLGTNITAEEADFLTYNFRANFTIDGYRETPRTRINGTIKELGFNRVDMTRQQMLKLGRELEAKLIVVGTINKMMDEYSAEVRALDVSTGLTCATVGDSFGKGDYRSVMEALATKLGKKLSSNSVDASNPDVGSGTSAGRPKAGFVDMGLSVNWASCNVGASKPEGYGSYLTFSDLSALNMRGMRVPTDDELTQLRVTCSWEWTTLNGVSGMKVTSPLTGNSIFLPAAGWRFSDGSMYRVGSSGYYWSSTPDSSDSSDAWYVYFNSSGVYRSSYSRSFGLSVRLVSE